MSMLSSSGIGQGIMQFVQQLAGSNQPAAVDASTTSTSTTPTTAAATPQTTPRHHHHHGGAFQKIADAVTGALQSAQSSGNSTDPDTVIKSAIEQILGGTNSATPGSTTGTTGTTTTPDPNSPQGKFLATLQSFGVSADQFQDDFAAAVKDAQGGQVNLNSIFQSFGSGSVLDTTG